MVRVLRQESTMSWYFLNNDLDFSLVNPTPARWENLSQREEFFKLLSTVGGEQDSQEAPALWVMRGWERGWGLASLHMTCWCHSAPCLPCLLNFLGVQWEILWLQFLPARCKAHPGWMGRDAKRLLTAPSASWVHWGRRTTPHPFLPDSGCSCTALLLIHCLALTHLFSQGASIFEFHGCSHCPQWFGSPKKKKNCHYFHCFPIYLPWSDKTRCHDLHFLNAEF